MNEKTYKVRIGTPLDHRPMMAFAMKMHEENGVAHLDPVRVEATIMCGLARHRALIGIIDGDNGEIAASVGLFLSQWWYSDTPHLEERWVFVSEPYRRRPLARPLLEFAKHAASSLELPLLIGVLSSARTEAKIKLYQRQFGDQAGALFFFDPRPESERADLPALRDVALKAA